MPKLSHIGLLDPSVIPPFLLPRLSWPVTLAPLWPQRMSAELEAQPEL